MARFSSSSLPGSTNPKRRIQPTPIEKQPFTITNLVESELVHQTCIQVQGECRDFEYADKTNYVSVATTDILNQAQPVHHWPLHKGHWKSLVMLSPGFNTILFKLHHCGGIADSIRITVNYVPLLQLPPLHLAIMVAKDSPLLIDCPPAKYGSISTAHSSLDAAIAKLRMSAYMWQAATAEDFRQKKLGRRSFRLDEEWMTNTVIQMGHQGSSSDSIAMRAAAKVHIIRSEKSVAEIRDADVAQQNLHGRNRDALHEYFEAALREAGSPFESASRPVVAGLILDSHYSPEKSMILGHAALGCHKPDGISLGIFGSHLTYSWPRFLEEVPACLIDMTPTGDTVGNDNGECDTMRGACFVGQGAFLHEVGHAFGSEHTSGIMQRGYSKSWAMNFVDHMTNDKVINDSKWDLRDVLLFKMLPHFALPGDRPMDKHFKNAPVKIEVDLNDILGNDGFPKFTEDSVQDDIIKVSCAAGIAEIEIQSEGEKSETLYMDETGRGDSCNVFINLTQQNADRTKSLQVSALGLNGQRRVLSDAWALLQQKPYVLILGSSVVLRKKSVKTEEFCAGMESTSWAMLLHHRGKDGELHRATSIDLRVGCVMDGAVVYYADGQHENCGPTHDNESDEAHEFGGHQSESHDLPIGETIEKVLVCRDNNDGWRSLAGIRMYLSNGDRWGALNNKEDSGISDSEDEDDEGEEDDPQVVTLMPEDDEVIVGFFGHSELDYGFTHEFGILTAPKDVELPDQVYDLPELRNIA
jgi:hypothetical protein